MSLFSTLNTGTSGLNAAQVAVATTSQNIANADNDYYTRQRVQFTASNALNSQGLVLVRVLLSSLLFVFMMNLFIPNYALPIPI